MSAPESLPQLGDRYIVLSRIGAGGMGTVYLARDTKHDRRVAIKVLDPDYARLVGPQRFLREIQILAALTHSNIVPLYDSGEVGAHLFYVMPYVEGESLRQRLDRETMLPVAEVLQWAAEVAEGLAFAHAHGIVHRDIKPENLLIQAGHVLIADFGIARAVDLAAGERITSQQLVLGTSAYMSPEQASGGERLDARTDVYSLACVVYEMASGEPPFRGASAQAVTAKKMAGSYPRLRVVRPSVPQALDRALARALAPHPADRIATADEFCKSMRAAAEPKAPRLVPWLAALGVLSAAAGLVVTQPWRRDPPAAVRQRVVVGIFENRTGESRHDPLGFMAADWVTEGLQRTGAVDVVPTLSALAASRFLRERAASADPIRALARETGASLVVSGSIYRDQQSLVLQAQLVNADSGRLVGAVEPIRTSEGQSVEALIQLRTRLMGLLALSLDDRVLQGERPPTYAAYQAFSEGMDAYVRNDYGPALVALERAYAADTTFVLPLLYAAFCHSNRREYALADSLLRIVANQRGRLNAHDRYLLDFQMAELAGHDSEALAAIRRAAELAPTSKATYNFAVRALETREAFQAESTLQRLSPDVGPMRGWLPYWDVLTSALHAQGKHGLELKAAREARRRFPNRVAAYIPETRALAAEGKATELERLWLEASDKGATPAELGSLAYEAGSELWAHDDSVAGQAWFNRAYNAFASADRSSSTVELEWGRARAAARLGRLTESFELCEALATRDTTQPEYLGLLGILAVQLGSPVRARTLVEQLAADTRPYTFGRPQFQAGRIAAVLGDVERATALLALADARGYPYDLTFHQDQALARLKGLPIMRQLDARHD